MKEEPVKKTTCQECGGVMVVRGYTHVTKIGRATVRDACVHGPQCEECGRPALTLDELERLELRAAKYALLDGVHTGDVVRYARKAVGLTQKELATVIDYTHETISRWETGKEPLPRAAAAAIVGVLCRALDGEDPLEMVRHVRAIDERGLVSDPEIDVPAPRRRVG